MQLVRLHMRRKWERPTSSKVAWHVVAVHFVLAIVTACLFAVDLVGLVVVGGEVVAGGCCWRWWCR